MINFKSGPSLSLHQVNAVGKTVTGQAIEAGMIVRLHTNSSSGLTEALKGSETGASATGEVLGFAINDQTDGDVIESGKIGVYLLDGASIVETTNFTGSASGYTIGLNVSANTDGTILPTAATGYRVIGQVVGTRALPAVQIVSGVKIQGTATFVAIKLAA